MIFVTGGTGLVGSHILLKLSEKGFQCKALKRKNSDMKVCQSIFNHYKKEHLFKKIIWEEGDVNDIPSLEKSMQGCKRIIHAAAIVSFHPKDQEIMYKVNVVGTTNIMNVAMSSNIEKVCYISSIAALGSDNDNNIDENSIFKFKNQSNYAISKYLSEQEVWRASAEGLNTVIINPSLILGPGDWNKGSSQIFQSIYKGLKFYTIGKTGFVDVLDVADCAIKMLESDIINEKFIVSAEDIDYRKIFDMIAKNFKKPKPTIKVTPILKEISWRIEMFRHLFTSKNPLITKESVESSMKIKSYSNEKIKRELGYKFIPIKESIANYCNWFLSERS